MKGSLTIESAIVIPTAIICLGVCILIILAFHDQSVLVSMEHELLSGYGEQVVDHTGIYTPPVVLCREDRFQELNKVLFLCEEESITYHFTMDNRYLYQVVTVDMQVPIAFPFKNIDYHHVSKKVVTSGTEIVRVTDFISDMASDFVYLAEARTQLDQGIEFIKIVLTK